MKKLIIVLAIFSSNTYGQILPESVVKQATGESIRISKILKIAIRPNLLLINWFKPNKLV